MNPSQNDNFIRLQNQIRQNTHSVHDYISELTEWTEDIEKKDVDVKHGKGVKTTSKKLPPIRSQKLEQERIKNNKSGSYLDLVIKENRVQKQEVVAVDENSEDKEYKRDVTPMPTYYNKWDKFDPNKAMEDVENDRNIKYDTTLHATGKNLTKTATTSKIYEPATYDDDLTEEEKRELEKQKFLKGTSGAGPNTQIVIKGGANPTPLSKIESTKKQGNTYFTSLEYEKAIE